MRIFHRMPSLVIGCWTFLSGPSNDHPHVRGEARTVALPGSPPAHPVSTRKYKSDVGDSKGAMCTRERRQMNKSLLVITEDAAGWELTEPTT